MKLFIIIIYYFKFIIEMSSKRKGPVKVAEKDDKDEKNIDL